MKKILLTGHKGKFGRVILQKLQGYVITAVDLPETDLTTYEGLPELFKGHDIILHFAWNSVTESWKSVAIDPNNVLLTTNIYRAAVEAKVPRVLMASSVHADNFFYWKGPGLL